MVALILSGAVHGVEAYRIGVEVDTARGLPCITVVGLPESAVREGRERVLSALRNAGFQLPPRRVTINLAPADVRKDGSAFDLPIAVGLLAADGQVPVSACADVAFLGELGLDGELRPVRGALPIAEGCRRDGVKALVLPHANAAEASAVAELPIYGARTLREVVAHLRGKRPMTPFPPAATPAAAPGAPAFDLADVKGQELARRALEVAAAGSHNLLMIGPPGAGKSMLARRLPGILPPLTRPEAIEVTKIYSVAGRLRPGQPLMTERPFRAPHHGISDAGLIGGGPALRPGEISLAHHGVLFLDELPEFRRPVVDALRQPMEDFTVQIGRARGSVVYPARVMVVGAMNPCPCGFRFSGDGECICHDRQAEQYLARISGPVFDRFDLHIEVPAVAEGVLSRGREGEPSAAVRARVLAARARQLERFAGRTPPVYANAHMGMAELRVFCRLDAASEQLMRDSTRSLRLSARAFHRVLRLARSIADLDTSARVRAEHVAEAIMYRSLDRRPSRQPAA